MNFTSTPKGIYEFKISNVSDGFATFYYRREGETKWQRRRGKLTDVALKRLMKYPELIDKIYKTNNFDEYEVNMPFQLIEFYTQVDTFKGKRYKYNGCKIDIVERGYRAGKAFVKDKLQFSRIVREYGKWNINPRFI